MAENKYQAGLIKRLKLRFPGCEILKNDANYIQGIEDLTLLWGPHWATLEVKDELGSSLRPNQRHYIEKHNDMDEIVQENVSGMWRKVKESDYEDLSDDESES